MKVAVIMGSKSDLPIMQDAIDTLALFEIETHVDIVSAHRTADKMMSFGKSAHENGIDVIIARIPMEKKEAKIARSQTPTNWHNPKDLGFGDRLILLRLFFDASNVLINRYIIKGMYLVCNFF